MWPFVSIIDFLKFSFPPLNCYRTTKLGEGFEVSVVLPIRCKVFHICSSSPHFLKLTLVDHVLNHCLGQSRRVRVGEDSLALYLHHCPP